MLRNRAIVLGSGAGTWSPAVLIWASMVVIPPAEDGTSSFWSPAIRFKVLLEPASSVNPLAVSELKLTWTLD